MIMATSKRGVITFFAPSSRVFAQILSRCFCSLYVSLRSPLLIGDLFFAFFVAVCVSISVSLQHCPYSKTVHTSPRLSIRLQTR